MPATNQQLAAACLRIAGRCTDPLSASGALAAWTALSGTSHPAQALQLLDRLAVRPVRRAAAKALIGQLITVPASRGES